MKGRLFIVFTLAIGLALLLIWAVVTQRTEVTAAVQLASSAISADRTEFHSGPQNVVRLGYTSDITFTPAFTTYLPAVLKGYGVCSTIPTLLSPANGSSLNTIVPLFRWDNGNDLSTTGMRLEVSDDSGFTGNIRSLWSGATLGVREFRFSSNLDPATTYYWRAWLMCDDIQGPYSDVWSFTTGSGGTILPAPALVAPASGSTVPTTTATLQWSSVPGAIEYLVYWRKVGQGGYAYEWVTDTQTTIGWLNADTTYEWWASARNDYAMGVDSEKWQFTTSGEALSFPSQDSNHNAIVIEDGDAKTTLERRGNESQNH